MALFKCSLHFNGNLMFLQWNSVGLVGHNKLTCQNGSPITSQHRSFGRAPVKHTVRRHTRSRVWVHQFPCTGIWIKKGLAAMLTIKKSARFALEVNLTNTLHTGDTANRQRIPLALKPRSGVTISPNQGYLWPHKEDWCPPKKIFLKKRLTFVYFTMWK